MTKFIRLFSLLFFFSLIGFSQISKVHYIPPLTTNEYPQGGTSWPYQQFMYLSTPSTENVSVTITPLNGDTPTTYNDLNNANPKMYLIGGSDSPSGFEESALFIDHDHWRSHNIKSRLFN